MNTDTNNAKKPWYKKWWGITIIVIIVVPVIRGITGDMDKAQKQVAPEKQQPVTQIQSTTTQEKTGSALSKEAAQKELDNIVLMGKKAGLVMSYDFSATGSRDVDR
jgi:flagellar biosynthesis/type III secretory pathway M-ring protein FliF/YscJ